MADRDRDRDRRRRRHRRQKPKHSNWRTRVTSAIPPGLAGGGRPQETTVTSTTFLTTPGVPDYPSEKDQHAVTTNQEPPASWPDVDLPPLTGYTVTDLPMDNGQADPATTYDPAVVETSPYYDSTGGNSSSGAGDMYPPGNTDPNYPMDNTDQGGTATYA